MIFETRDLSYRYKGSDRLALDGVNLQFNKKKRTVVLGANGAGKSTLFFSLNGVFKPECGSVLYNGEPISYNKKDLMTLRSDIAVVLQNPDDHIFSTTVEEDVAFGPLNIGLTREETEMRLEEALSIVGMSEYRKRSVQQISYGQKKRIALAGALALKPKVMILDEPTSGMDPRMSEEVMELTDTLFHEGTTVILSTHDIDLAYSWADEVHVLSKGKALYSGDSDRFYSNDRLVKESGLVRPMLFDINKNLAELESMENISYPRTPCEMISKTIPSIKTGTLFRIHVTEDLREEVLQRARQMAGNNVKVGIYGANARKYVTGSNVVADYSHDAMESCISDIIAGHNAIFCCDRELSDIVGNRISKLTGFGTKIVIEDIS